MSTDDGVVLATVIRSGVVENIHRGTAVILDTDGRVARAWGDPMRVVLPRSSSKIGQATALVELGFDGPDEFIAMAAASHSGSPQHLAWVDRILEAYEIDPGMLQTPADYPLGEEERRAWLMAGNDPARRAMNCSGKHAAMLATGVVHGWPLAHYLAPDHPVQRHIAHAIAQRAEESIAVTAVDGCGAPLLGLRLQGLARMAQVIAQAPAETPDARVAQAMRTFPELVGGHDRDVTIFMRQLPGLLAKDGADGVYVGVDPSGAAFALKLDDGANRPRNAVVAGLLAQMGWSVELPEHHLAVLGGGRPVGRIDVRL